MLSNILAFLFIERSLASCIKVTRLIIIQFNSKLYRHIFITNGKFREDSVSCLIQNMDVLDLDVEMINVKYTYKYVKRKPIHDLLFDGNTNFYSVCRHFQDSDCRKLYGLDLDL